MYRFRTLLLSVSGFSIMASNTPTAIFFHDGFDTRPSERRLIREAIQESAPALSESLSPEWIVVRQDTGGEPLYVVHYRTQCTTATAATAEALANQIRNGAFPRTRMEANAGRSSASSRSSDASSARKRSPVAEE
jgi:hypothetical protein